MNGSGIFHPVVTATYEKPALISGSNTASPAPMQTLVSSWGVIPRFASRRQTSTPNPSPATATTLSKDNSQVTGMWNPNRSRSM